MSDEPSVGWRHGLGQGYDYDLFGHKGAVTAVGVATYDGETVIVSGGVDHTLCRWDGRTGLPLGDPVYHPDQVTSGSRRIHRRQTGRRVGHDRRETEA